MKNVGRNLTHFCLGQNWNLFSVRSKIHAFCGTLLREVLILVPNQNCAKKIYAGFLPGLEITSLKSCFMTIAQYDAEIFKQRFHYKICMKIAHFFCRQIPSWHKITKVAHIFLEQSLKSSKKLRKSFITKYQKEYFNSENELKIKLL